MFTGSRVSEYAQSKLSRGARYNTVPSNAAAGPQGGLPIAFTTADLALYTRKRIQITSPNLASAFYLTIRFRYTKGVHNFVHRTYASLPGSPLCPISAATRLLTRHHLLQMKSHDPLMCFLPARPRSAPCFLRDTHVTSGLRAAVVDTYPDEKHICRVHIAAISSRSIRVFACLCLRQAGWDLDSISHHLRWSSDAVKYYIHQSPFAAVDLSASLMASSLSST